MVTKCLEHINCPSELGLYFDAQVPTTIYLKKLIACQFLDNNISPKLTLNIAITANAVVTIIDDLCVQDNDQCTCAWNNNLNFLLHANSTLTYRMQAPQKTLPVTQQGLSIEKNLTFTFIGTNAHATAICSCRGAGNTAFTFNTVQDHQVAHTTSTLLIKSAMADQSKIVSNNTIHIHKDCNNVSAQQITKTLLLGTECCAQAKPQLKIEADKIHCRHEATMSRLNKDQLFYLQSRGLSLMEAQTTFINGFLEN